MSDTTPKDLPQPLPVEALYTRCDLSAVAFATTDDLADFTDPLGQDRAVEAIRFGIGMKSEGFNMYCLGREGTGKTDLVRRYLEQAARDEAVPDDWVYVHNFKNNHKPRALCLPRGRAEAFAKDMNALIEEIKAAIPAAFETEEYRKHRREVEIEVKATHDKQLAALQKRAEEQDIAIVRTPVGLALAPTKDGDVLGPEEFNGLPENKQLKIKQAMAELQDDVEALLRDAPKVEKEQRERVRELNREVADFAVGHLIASLMEDYGDLEPVTEHLQAVHKDVVENVDEFYQPGETQNDELQMLLADRRSDKDAWFRRYRVNVLVHHEDGEGAPVVYVDHPTQPNLIGRVEHRQQFGALLTDFNLIKPGALHTANGGYLVIDARLLLTLPFGYEDLKRALRSREIKIEAPGAAWGYFSTVTLEPEPIPLKVKVVLVGEPMIYYLLSRYDPDFDELFKVAADFDTRMDKTERTVADYARLLATLARKNDIRPMSRDAVARVIEQSSRLADDTTKLSTHMASITDLMLEADYWSRAENSPTISAQAVQRAVDAQRRRADRIPQSMKEMIERHIILIDTEGATVGQINGLAVFQLGRQSFGQPSRITARVRIGKGEVLDIERETQMGGPIHTKGVLILSSYLSSRYAEDRPLSLSASLVFEQNYGEVDGDSASSTELYALLSALSEVPIRQGLAVTGSLNQFGEVQAIGGVNEKIEGFFDLCAARGLSGDQGVLIPRANVAHLMLKPEVLQAVADGRFAIYPVDHVDQGIELLTGVPAGTWNEAKKEWSIGSINRRVAAKLESYVRKSINLDQMRQPPQVRHNRRRRDDNDSIE